MSEASKDEGKLHWSLPKPPKGSPPKKAAPKKKAAKKKAAKKKK